MSNIKICVAVDPMSEKIEGLTSRELYILTKIAEGKTNKQIAADMQVSVHTVKANIAVILHKMNVKYRVQAVIKALFLKLIVII